MRAFALTCEALAHLESIEGKVQCAAAYLSSRAPEEVEIAARFLSGSPLPPGSTAPRVGSATIANLIAERAGVRPESVRRRAVSKGDFGTAVAAALDPLGAPDAPPLALLEVAATLAQIGEHAAQGRLRRLRKLFERTDGMEAKYLTKLLLGSLRTGMQAARVEDTIALAYRRPVEAVRRGHMLLGDIGLTAARAREGTLDEIRLQAFRPVRSMLAYPAASAEDVLENLQLPLLAEHKFDGVRAQMHVNGPRHHIYSRGLDDFTHLFPELGNDLDVVSDDWIIDGEIIAWEDGPLGFGELQQRLGRRQVPLTMLLDIPVVFFAFDVLRASGRDLIDEPLRERKRVLERLPVRGTIRLSPSEMLTDAGQIAASFQAALDAGHEGTVYKDPESTYRPGTRGRAWLKLKRPVGTLDVVVTAAQYGRGKRAGRLSDFTFAVRRGDDLLDVGKAYSGLTDAEILELTEHFKETSVSRRGDEHRVEPQVILEVAFGGVQRSTRHPSGFALRFPRILRQRPDLSLADIDTVERVEEIFRQQATRSHEM